MDVTAGAGDAGEVIDPRGREHQNRQLAAILRRRIRDGRYPPGRVLPSEQQLRDEFGISRNTARRAIEVLRDEGLAETVPGRGTYVVDQLPDEGEEP